MFAHLPLLPSKTGVPGNLNRILVKMQEIVCPPLPPKRGIRD